ncbi:carboxyl transferase domain-containing protein [Pseudomonas sp. dw_358]|uniref:acyl-CoA carboxylase subunit beta n=1 Tax=Pseudomonas sp. dw_358 TaxID=2720083 RepID=UPI001BD32AC8|nr:carboxyl transferase domain-containing protein [Pseudomonas sp. dw_358]
MTVLQATAPANSKESKARREAHLALLENVRALERKVVENSARATERMRKRGQLLPRERIALLLDRNSEFLELSTLCGLGMHDDDGAEKVLGAGVIAGVGEVEGRRVMIMANDAGIAGGAMHPMGIQKIIRAQEIALRNRLPYLQLVESAGANLALQAELFVEGGKQFANLARLSAAGVPVIAVVHGSSTAGGAYQPGMSDYVIMVRGRSKVFLAGPPLLRAATGEIAEDEVLGGAEMHAHVTGLSEYLAENDSDALRLARELVARVVPLMPLPPRASDAPLRPGDDILAIAPADYREPHDLHHIIARFVDGSRFLPFKSEFGFATLCGNAQVGGHEIGIIGNNGPIDSAGANKAAHFIQACCQAGTPILFLQNTTGFMVGAEAEASGIVKHGAKLIQAVTNATVPKLTLQIGGAFGAGAYAMCGRAFDPHFIFSWPTNRLAVMGGEQAAKVMTIVAQDSARARGIEPDHPALHARAEAIRSAYERESTALYATARLWDDGIIDPRDTRAVLLHCLETIALGQARSLHSSTFGTARY